MDLEFEYKSNHGGGGGGGRQRGSGESSICQWLGNGDFQYKILRFWEKYGREMVFSTLDGAGN